jgi:hypothetical protein
MNASSDEKHLLLLPRRRPSPLSRPFEAGMAGFADLGSGAVEEAHFPKGPPRGFLPAVPDHVERHRAEHRSGHRRLDTTQEVLKRIIKRFPNDESIQTSVIISLESTGVVMGEFGFADALRDKLETARSWQTDPRSEVRAFADAHIQRLQLRIADQQRRAEERKALREPEYDQRDEPQNK